MTSKAEQQRLECGEDPIANAIIAYLAQQGWSADTFWKHAAGKRYAPHRALMWVQFDSDNQLYYVIGDYTSEGHNVLGACLAIIKATASQAEIEAAMARCLQDAERRINQSYAVRIIGDRRSSCNQVM